MCMEVTRGHTGYSHVLSDSSLLLAGIRSKTGPDLEHVQPPTHFDLAYTRWIHTTIASSPLLESCVLTSKDEIHVDRLWKTPYSHRSNVRMMSRTYDMPVRGKSCHLHAIWKSPLNDTLHKPANRRHRIFTPCISSYTEWRCYTERNICAWAQIHVE